MSQLVDRHNGVHVVGSIVTEFNKATGRERTGWEIFQIIERGGSAAIGISRPCSHVEVQKTCYHHWCPGIYRKWVSPSALSLRLVSDDSPLVSA